ncbi:MAG: CBS domain containing-hemolysin-like protein [Rhodothermales bacterium]|jgi:CBS domain containing-hemolysin-like protein
MIELIIAVSLSAGISAMCSLFEAVLYSVPVGHIETLVADGRHSGTILRDLRKDIDRPIAAILSLNTVANTAGAAVAGAAAMKVFGGGAPMIWFSAIFTLVILLFSEVIPKTAGVTYSRPLSTIVARPLALLVRLFTPMVFLCRLVTRLLRSGEQDHGISEEELIVMVRLGGRTGAIDEDEAAVMQNILGLADKTVGQVMTPRTVVCSLSASATLNELRESDDRFDHSRIPIYNESIDDIIGIVHRRDLLRAMMRQPGETTVETLAKPVAYVPQSKRLDELLREFLARREHLQVVIDQYGGFAGVITLEDLLEAVLGQQIVDEFDKAPDMRELAKQRRDEIIGTD